MSNPSAQDPSRLGRATARLAGALDRLEATLEAGAHAAGPEAEGLAEALAAAKQEGDELRNRQSEMVQRLDGVIARLRAVLGGGE